MLLTPTSAWSAVQSALVVTRRRAARGLKKSRRISDPGLPTGKLGREEGVEFLDGAEIGLGRFVFRIPGVLPVEAERGGRFPAEPRVILPLDLQDLRVVPVL